MKKNLLLLIVLFVVNFASGQVTATIVDDAPFNYDDVEVRPEFPGGYNNLLAFIAKNFKLTDYEGYGGTLKVAFIIETDGSITNIKVVKDLGEGTGVEAKRVMLMSPKWSPGELGGKKVRVLYELPIKVAGQG
ncbi:energy transducer TonB [Flavobacterium aquiphilum]|uniref:energy transducer TonB n=1 Tax=Flavobacterium aquiphilum TaxID=3003261 RepID=UPI0024805C29|nr:energy transducer TonB [Flavobacterium aquiphilum]